MPAQMKFVDPYIRVNNVARSAEWYIRMLGLEIEMAMPEGKKPAFIRLTSGTMALMIGDGSDATGGKKVPKSTIEAISTRKAQRVVSFYYRTDGDINALHRSVRRKGAKIVSPPQNMPHGMRQFTMRDPDGYEVTVGKPL